ncbi:hypothetical protein DFQ27_008321 [Actinomortierella ambigua]|uniref:Small ribosomal subunit protein uS7 domain-containing protein n=1 Tax=Actinomortierella ambigua TaxID=1343610 RepID=A0A9P6PU04_9FUNG|nr:hypothetical protein DFQ27_008321 [Actinomortierella ambigua]
MLRSLVRSAARSAPVTSQWKLMVPRQTAIAAFHMGTRPSLVSASSNASTTPSTPLPPKMPSTPTESIATTATTPSSESQKATDTPASDEEMEAIPDADLPPLTKEQLRSLTENPVLSQLVNTIMKDGKKARAQRFVADALLEIRARTQSDPYEIVLDAIAQTCPILKLTAIKKGSKVLQVPTPMTERQRRRKAIVWILEASDSRKRSEKYFGDRLASEMLAVVNGNSGALRKKEALHKMALANRANASLKY